MSEIGRYDLPPEFCVSDAPGFGYGKIHKCRNDETINKNLLMQGFAAGCSVSKNLEDCKLGAEGAKEYSLGELLKYVKNTSYHLSQMQEYPNGDAEPERRPIKEFFAQESQLELPLTNHFLERNENAKGMHKGFIRLEGSDLIIPDEEEDQTKKPKSQNKPKKTQQQNQPGPPKPKDAPQKPNTRQQGTAKPKPPIIPKQKRGKKKRLTLNKFSKSLSGDDDDTFTLSGSLQQSSVTGKSASQLSSDLTGGNAPQPKPPKPKSTTGSQKPQPPKPKSTSGKPKPKTSSTKAPRKSAPVKKKPSSSKSTSGSYYYYKPASSCRFRSEKCRGKIIGKFN